VNHSAKGGFQSGGESLKEMDLKKRLVTQRSKQEMGAEEGGGGSDLMTFKKERGRKSCHRFFCFRDEFAGAGNVGPRGGECYRLLSREDGEGRSVIR